jgi:hypothetical protein
MRLWLAARSYIIYVRYSRDSKSIDNRDLGIVTAANRPKPPAHTSRSHYVSRHFAGPILRMSSVQYNIRFHLTWDLGLGCLFALGNVRCVEDA